MESSNTSNQFQDYINKLFMPSCIVYSTEDVKKSIGKNNLSPAEFLRPFGNFNGYNINFSFGDKFTINIKNFRIDFHDSHRFRNYNNNLFNEALDLVLAYNAPDWDYKQLNLTNRAFLELFKKKLKNYSTSWFDEYERLICESLRFNVYEMFQQPLANIYVASAHDEVETIELLKKKNIPSLLSDNIYEPKLASMILLLNDLSERRVSNEKLISKINIIKNKNPRTLVMFLDINSQDIADNESKLDDIWLPYLHKTDIYNSNFINCDRGKFISLNEREIFKTSIFNFFDDYVKSYLQKLMLDLDEEVSNNKKGIKNGLLSIFKKSEKPEYINYEGNSIYKLTSLEKKIYLLSIIQFYLRDYDNCFENLRLLQNDLKGKSTEHFNSINELLNIVKFLNGKRDIDFDSVYTAYKKQNLKIAFRFLMIYIRMLEASKKYNEITKILVKFVNEIPLSYITPLLLEKLAIAHLYSAPVNIRKFCLYQALTAIAFRNTKTDMKKYVLNNFGNVIKFFLKNSASFVKIKEYINLTVADICLNSNKFDGGQIFYRNYLELSANKNSDQEQDYIINHYLKCIASANSAHMDKLLYVPLNYFSIPEVINTSLIVIHEQDQENCNGRNWRNFKQFSKVKERIWANLTENDMNVINNLDNIIEGKQNFTNQQVFKCATNNKIIVKFVIKNPLNLLLNVSKLKLICDFVPKDNSVVKPPPVKFKNMNGNPISSNEDNDENKTENECIIYDEKSVNLDRFEEKLIDLYCIPKKPGQLIIRGLEIGLFKMALFNHSFYEKTLNDLYKQKDNYVRSKPKHILYDVTDEKQDISIKFSNKDLTLFKSELFFLKIKIQNNSNAKLKRYSVFLDDNDNDLHIKIDNKSSNNNNNNKRGSKGFHSSSFSSHSHMSGLDNISQQQPNFYHEEKPIIGNVSIFKYFHREVDIAIPLCPQYEGEFKLKVLIKFEEESKFKEIEIRRFLLKVKVIPSVNLSYAQQILNFNRNKIDLSLNFNYHLYNTFDLSNLKIGRIFTNEFLVKSEENINWITLANEKYSKLYSQIKLKYNIEEEKIKQEQLAIAEKKAKKLSRIIANEKNPFENIDIHEKDLYLFDFVLFYSELQNEKNGINQSALENLIGAAGDNLAKLSDIGSDSINNKDLDYNKNFSSAAQKAEANKLNLMSLYEISLKFKELLNKKKNVFISYSITDKTNNYEFQGLNILSLTINPQSLNYKKIKNIVKEITEVQVSTEILTNSLENQQDGAIESEENSNITFVNVKIKMKNLFQHLELSCFEIFVHDEDNEFDWLGIKKYKIKEDGNNNSNSNEKDFVNEFDFNFSTNKKGIININRFNINIIPNLNPDKVITISYIPHPIIVDL